MSIPSDSRIRLRSQSIGDGHHLQFSYALDEEDWKDAGDSFDAADLPAWDRGLRIGMMLEGPAGRSADFYAFRLSTGP